MATRPAPSPVDVERAFAEAMAANGFVPGPIKSETEGFVRFDAPGDKKGKANGFYKLKLGDLPVGWFGDWKTSEQHQWTYDNPGRSLSAEERRRIKERIRWLQDEAKAERARRHAEVAENASRKWKVADPSGVADHAYLAKKRITQPRGLRVYTARDGARLLAVPMYIFDANGEQQLINLQFINEGGEKRFLTAGRVEGAFFPIRGDDSITVECEGVATGFSIWEATGATVLCGFNAGNLIEVAKACKEHRPQAQLLIAGDDDAFAPDDWADRGRGKPWVNAGSKKAEAAAKAVGCRWSLPHFDKGPSRDRKDYNDLHREEGLEAVKAQILGGFGKRAENETAGAEVIDISHLNDESWRTDVPKTAQGSPDGANVKGVELFIINHKLLRSRLRYNNLTRLVEIDGNPLEDEHISMFRNVMHADRFKARKPDVLDEMMAEAKRHQYDPLLDYLASVKWDGKGRLDTWTHRLLGVPDSLYTRRVGRKFLVGAVARARLPGCKMDTMLVLEGPQGVGKSTAIRYLFGDRFFIDHLPDFHSKDSFMQLQGAWCVEVAEMSALSKADVKDVKQFLSRLVDKYRPPYGKQTVQVGRRTVLTGTMNPDGNGWILDSTGGRRFWPMECGEINLPGMLDERDQLWAEAVRAFEEGETWHLTDSDEILAATEEQAARRQVDPWEGQVKHWLDLRMETQTTCGEVLAGINVPTAQQTTLLSRRVGACLRAIGWKPKLKRRSGGAPEQVFFAPGHHPDEQPVSEADDLRRFDPF